MSDNFIITTTPTVEGWTISRYIGPVVIPAVGGADFIRDWLAGWTDMFGGKSKAYQEVFDKFIRQATSQMINEARQSGANAVVNLRFEFTNVQVTEKKAVIAVILYGTAVVVEKTQPSAQEQVSDA